ncbi:NAD-dependent malic enzyme [bacterium CG10_big_fil_rev_8_21_14_0_10_33_18]|nr:MAG: NAD-dependent malic enzyme [bacterium CG10_big_fil_rev_8_21_14_0_10_33_18]
MDEALDFHKKYKGKIQISLKAPLDKDTLKLAYTPGVAEVSLAIAQDKKLTNLYTNRGNTVAIITDGSAVLGLGNIGPEAALPVMEGKAALFKKFGNVDAIPIILNTQDTEKIIKSVKAIFSSFAGINLEDISAPRCFEIEEKLDRELPIPVFHDDQHGTAIVVLAALINSLRVVDKNKEAKIVISGAGAAGTAITKLLLSYGFKNLAVCDSKAIIESSREDLNGAKQEIAKVTSPNIKGICPLAYAGADVFIGVSAPNILSPEMVKSMAKYPIIFALANPNPEIKPDLAKKAGARVVATGRSDYPNQINNVLAFPGVFRGALDSGAKSITHKMKIAAALALADYVKNPNENNIIPSVFDDNVSKIVAESVINESKKLYK